MAELIGMPRAAWRRQPSGYAKISPIWQSMGLKIATTPGIHLEPPISQNVPTRVRPSGVAYDFNDTDRYLMYRNTLTSSDVSVFVLIDPDIVYTESGQGIGTYVSSRTIGNSGWSFYDTNAANFGDGNEVRSIAFAIQGVAEYTQALPTGTLPAKFGKKTVGCRAKSGSPVDFFVDGVKYPRAGAIGTIVMGGDILIGKVGPYDSNLLYYGQPMLLAAVFDRFLDESAFVELNRNHWQLFAPDPPRFYLIPSGGSSPTCQISVDALIQRAGLTQTTSLDALLQSAFSRSLSIDGLIAATQAGTINLDALLQIVGTHTVSVDALLQATKTGAVSVDALLQATLSQALSLDALIQAIQSAGLSLDALLSKPMTVASVMDALIQAAKTGTVSLDAIIIGASSMTVFVGLDALIQAIQAKTISLDALLQKSYTSPLALDAYVALTQVKTMSLDALLQSTKSGVISMDAILQMTKTAMVSFDALIQAAKTGVISLDAILVFATQASVLLDAYVQRTLSRGVGLDAIIGSIADMILPTGRVITVPASDRFVFVTHSDRVIQIQ